MKIRPGRPMSAARVRNGHQVSAWKDRRFGPIIVTLLCAGGVIALVVSPFTKGVALRLVAFGLLAAGIIYAYFGDRIRQAASRAKEECNPVTLLPVRVKEKRQSCAIHMNSDGSVRTHTTYWTLVFQHLEGPETYEFEVREAQYNSVPEGEIGVLHVRNGAYVGFERV